jgi:tetratricopeptide (TPR) repeat protein
MPARGPRRRGRPHARRALEFNPKNPGALNNLGIALFGRREYQEVPGCYKCAIVLTSEFAHAHSNRGNVLHALRRLHDAEAACRRAIELDPRRVRAWNNLGTTLRDLERPQEAVAAYSRALAEAPNDPAALDNLVLVLKDPERRRGALIRYPTANAEFDGPASASIHVGQTRYCNRGREDLYRTGSKLWPCLFMPHRDPLKTALNSDLQPRDHRAGATAPMCFFRRREWRLAQ